MIVYNVFSYYEPCFRITYVVPPRRGFVFVRFISSFAFQVKEYEIKIDQMDKHIKTQDDEIKTLKEKVDTLMGNEKSFSVNIAIFI